MEVLDQDVAEVSLVDARQVSGDVADVGEDEAGEDGMKKKSRKKVTNLSLFCSSLGCQDKRTLTFQDGSVT